MKIVGYQIFLRITRFVILVIRPDYQKFCLRSTPVHRRKHRYLAVSVTDNGNPGAVPHSPRPPWGMENSTTCTNRNAQSTPLNFKSRADRIMTACNRSSANCLSLPTSRTHYCTMILLTGSAWCHNAVNDWFDLQRAANEK